jgi:hypothetical protein
MSAGNWAQWSTGSDGSQFTTDAGIVLVLYKDYVHVLDEKGWRDGFRYTSPVVLVLDTDVPTEGVLHYGDLYLAWKKLDGVRETTLFYAIHGLAEFAGIGTYTFGPDGKYLGVETWQRDALVKWVGGADGNAKWVVDAWEESHS